MTLLSIILVLLGFVLFFGASAWFNEGKNQLARGADSATDWTTDTIKVILMKSGYTFNAETQDFYDDVSANECDATNYTAGGQQIDNPTVTESAGTVTFDADNEVFSAIGGASNNTLSGAIIYKDTGTPSTSPLLFWVEFSSTIDTNGGDITVQFNASGIATAA